MGTVVVAQGSQGELVRRLQQHLVAAGIPPVGVDGRYGLQTVIAVCAKQTSAGLPVTGEADSVTWSGVTGDPPPSLLERALQVTAAFEGPGLGLAQGNFDEAGITWGIIGFTLRHSELQRIIQNAFSEDPSLVRSAFSDDSNELLHLLTLPLQDQLSWADQHSTGKSRATLAEPWRSHFQALGDQVAVQQKLRAHP